MFRCVLCVRELPDELATEEHIFPAALGGLLKFRQLCRSCNNHFGLSVDASLVDHGYMLWARRRWQLANRAGKVPNPTEHCTTGEGHSASWKNDGRVYYRTRKEHRDGRSVLFVDETDLPVALDAQGKAKQRRGEHLQVEVIRPGLHPCREPLLDPLRYRHPLRSCRHWTSAST